MLQMSKGFAVSAQSVWALQTARRYLLTRLDAETTNGRELVQQIKSQESVIEQLQEKVSLLGQHSLLV